MVMVVGAAQSLSPKEARNAIADIPGFELDPKLIRIKNIDPGSGGAIVEAQFNMFFRLEKDKEWEVAELRLSNGKWEDIELVVTAVRNEKIKRTKDRLQALVTAIKTYHQEYSYYPRARDIVELTDILAPKYINTVIRADLWSNQLQYTTDGKTYSLQSPGPDGKPGTDDDIAIENGSYK
jgi:hypothetical protein